jgi:hypothetical protein
MAASSSPLLSFLTQMHEDPDAKARFEANPADEMTKAGLSADDQALVQNKDNAGIQAAVAAQTGAPAPAPPGPDSSWMS